MLACQCWPPPSEVLVQDGAESVKIRTMIGRDVTEQFRGGKALRCERNERCRGGFLGQDCLIEVSEVRYASLVEQDVCRSDVSVNNATPMDVSKCPTQLPGCAQEVSERHLCTAGLKISTVITESPSRQVFEHEVWTRRVKIEVMQRNDAIVCSYLAHHLHFPLTSGRSRA